MTSSRRQRESRRGFVARRGTLITEPSLMPAAPPRLASARAVCRVGHPPAPHAVRSPSNYRYAKPPRTKANLMASIGVVGQHHPVLVIVRDDGQRVVIDSGVL